MGGYESLKKNDAPIFRIFNPKKNFFLMLETIYQVTVHHTKPETRAYRLP